MLKTLLKILLDNKDNKHVKKFMKYYQSYMFHILDIKYAELTFDGLCNYIGALINSKKQHYLKYNIILKEYYDSYMMCYMLDILNSSKQRFTEFIIDLFHVKEYLISPSLEAKEWWLNRIIDNLANYVLIRYFNPNDRTYFLNKQFIQDEKDRYS